MENIPSGFIKPPEKKSNPDLALVSVSAIQAPKFDTSAILSTNLVRTVPELNSSQFTEDGLFITPKQPLNRKVMKPYPSTLKDPIKEGKSHRKHFTGKLLEVAIRDILVHSEQDCEQSSLQISSASVLFKEKSICQESYPFNRKLHKFLIRNPPDFVHFSVQIFGQDGSSVKVPIPFPKHEVRNKKLEIDFGITDGSGQAFSGLLVCTVSVKVREEEPKVEIVHHPPSEDPNNPQRIFSIPRWRNEVENQAKNYFLLEDPALVLKSQERQLTVSRAKKDLPKTPEIVVLEPTFSLMSFAFIRNCFLDQTQLPKIPTIPTGQQPKGKQMLTVTILRGIEVPVREESALVQPVVEVEWCNIVHSTAVADGPAPVWQQTLQFKVSRISGEQHIKLRLFDQHPIWGPQWLGETLIPLESLNINLNQEVERWIGLNPLRSPTHLFGYIQASPGYSYTRLYVLMKMHQMGVAGRVDEGSLEGLSKSIQKCLSVPYKIDQLEDPQEIAKLVTLLSPVPAQYGPVKPKQALDLNKVDPFGRAALLTTLFHGLGLQAYVLLGSSQTSKLTSYCLTTDPNLNTYLWDPDSGNYYDLNDSRCSLTTVFRLIDPKTIWDNTQKSLAPSTLKYNPGSNRDWQALSFNSATENQSVQILQLHSENLTNQQDNIEAQEMEKRLKDCLTQWRDALELSTTFNQHAESVLRNCLVKENSLNFKFQYDKKTLRQLYRIFYVHGFIINLRYIKIEELLSLMLSTKSHMVNGPVEFGLVCLIQNWIGKIRSIKIGFLILKSRE